MALATLEGPATPFHGDAATAESPDETFEFIDVSPSRSNEVVAIAESVAQVHVVAAKEGAVIRYGEVDEMERKCSIRMRGTAGRTV